MLFPDLFQTEQIERSQSIMISIAGQFHSGEEITNDGMEPLWNLRNIPDCSFGEGKVLEKPNMGGICL